MFHFLKKILYVIFVSTETTKIFKCFYMFSPLCMSKSNLWESVFFFRLGIHFSLSDVVVRTFTHQV